ncbi:unnamed protein product [Mytilus coruscus]|uniref:B box-type domain-containing protein n=1 Tax=Mytilus coruscus TaxID=42192 RepID=A0A6J8DML5_MYTCO|nr:unnamed protein product [Mytilus coruscus]
MANNPKLCSICDLRHLTKPSTTWCSECDQALCDECKEYHSLSRGTQNHETIGIDDYQSLAQSVNVYSSYCSTHNDKYQMYCQTHDSPLCLFCVEEHSECKDVIHLSKKTKDIKTSDTCKDTEQSLVDIDENIDKMEAEVKKNIEDFGEQKGSILANISRVRQEIKNHLDKLEESFRNEVTKIEDQSTRCMKDTLQMLDEKKSKGLKYQQQLQDMKKHASDLQTYLGLRQISFEIAKLESSFQSVIENGSLDKVSLTCSINESLNHITRSIQTFGTLGENKTSTSITYIRKKDKQAQIIGVDPKSIDDIKVKLRQQFDIDSKEIRGCDILPDKRLVFSDYNSSRKVIVITDTDGKQPITISLSPSNTFDMTCVDNNTVAVTSGTPNKGINIVDIESKTIKQTILTENACHGITHNNGLLFCCVEKKGIYRVDLKDSSVKHIIKRHLSNWSYVSSFNDKLYFTQKDDSIVTCCDIDGKTNWNFKDTSILNKPGGLTLDNEGNIYIVSRQNNSVVVLSPDGQQSRNLLPGSFDNPFVLKFDKDRNYLLITNENSTAFLLEIYT